MGLLQLQYFCTIAQYENIARAAKALFVSQPNLSTSLSRLEDDLCVKLFERRRGKVSLTENGQLFLSYAERVLNELNAGIKAVQAAEQANFDQLRVVSSQLDFIGEILQKYPADRRITNQTGEMCQYGRVRPGIVRRCRFSGFTLAHRKRGFWSSFRCLPVNVLQFCIKTIPLQRKSISPFGPCVGTIDLQLLPG